MLFDTRLADRNLREGFITREEYEKHLAGLPDMEHETVSLEVRPLGVLWENPEEEE